MKVLGVIFILFLEIIMFYMVTQYEGIRKMNAISCFTIIITFVKVLMYPDDIISNRVWYVISLFLMTLYIFSFLKKTNSLIDVTFLSGGVAMLAMYAAIISITFSYFIFWIFKILFMIILICIVLKYAAFGKYVSVFSTIIAYITMIIVNAMLFSNVLYSLIPDFQNNFYVTVSAMYALPDLEKIANDDILISYLINFIICRIMDAVLLGSVVNTLFTGISKQMMNKN